MVLFFCFVLFCDWGLRKRNFLYTQTIRWKSLTACSGHQIVTIITLHTLPLIGWMCYYFVLFMQLWNQTSISIRITLMWCGKFTWHHVGGTMMVK